jgi:hypothetical protein
VFTLSLPPFHLSLVLFLSVSGLFWGVIFFFSREKNIQNKMNMKARRGVDVLKRDGFLLTKTSHTLASPYSVDLATQLFSPKSTVCSLVEGLFGPSYDLLHPFLGDTYYFLTEDGSRMIVSTEKLEGEGQVR